MAISIRRPGYADTLHLDPCTGPHTVVLEPEDLTPGARIYCFSCGESVATIERDGDSEEL